MRRLLGHLLFLIVLLGMLVTAAAAQDTGVTAQAFRTVNVRQGPGTNYDLIGQLESGDIVPVLGRSDSDNNWLLIQFGDAQGWVAFFTVTVIGDPSVLEINDLQMVSAPPAQASAPGSAAPFVSSGAVTTGEPYVTAYRRINVRLDASSSAGRLGYMNPGNVADITGVSDDGEWIRVDFEGRIGWVAYFVVAVSGDINSVPVIYIDRAPRTPVPVPTRTPAPLDIRIQTSFNTNLRAAPDFNAAVVGTIPYETELSIEARTADNVWFRVTYQGQTGWIVASLVDVHYTYYNQRIEQIPVGG